MNLLFTAFVRRCLLLIVLIIVGVTNGIIGPTLIYLEKLTASREDEVTLVFTAKAVGSLAGGLFGSLMPDSRFGCKPYNLICASTFGLFTVFILLPWLARLWWIMAGFTFHGLFISLILQGALSTTELHRHNRRSWSHYFLFANLFGCILAPLIGFPFLVDSSVSNQLHSFTTKSTAVLSQQNKSFTPLPHFEKLPVKNNSHFVHSFHRSRRTVTLLVSPVTPTVRDNLNKSIKSNTAELPPHSQLRPIVKENATNISYPSSVHSTTVSSNFSVNLTHKLVPKPSITDAKHLSQDSSAADGSKAAAIMKQLSEKRRIEKVNNVPVTVPPVVSLAPTPSKISQETVVTHENNISSAIKSGKTENSKVFLNSSVIATGITRNENYTDLSGNSNRSSTLNTVKTPASFPVNQSVVDIIERDDQLIAKERSNQKSSKNDEKSIGTAIMNDTKHAPNASIKQHMHPSGNVSIAPNQNTTTQPPSLTYRKNVLEYWSTTTLNRSFFLKLPLLPVQKVYLFVSFIILFIWLIPISLVGWFQCGCKLFPGENSPPYENTTEFMRLRRRDEITSTDEFTSPTLSPSPLEPLISHQTTQHDKNEYEKLTVPAFRTSPCSTRMSCNHFRSSTPSKAITDEEVNFFTSTPPWPIIRWPSDAWMLTSEFLNSGLETAFGAFIYGFTIRYLSWSPSVSLLATSLFWFGDLVGRLPHWLLADSSSETVLPASGVSRRRSFPFAKRLNTLFILRITGCLLCVIVSAVLTHLSTPTGRCVAASANENASTSHLTWIFGSLLLGVGLGISSNGPPTLTTTNTATIANRLFLTSVLGQLILPPIIGYVHHIAVVWRHSCALSSATLTISLLMTVAQLANTVYLTYFD